MIRDMDEFKVSDKEWKELLGEALEESKDMKAGKTSVELGEIWGLKKSRRAEKIKILLTKGLIELGEKTITTLAGARRKVPAYRMVKK